MSGWKLLAKDILMSKKTKELADSVGAVYPVLFMGRHDGVLFTETELETFVDLVAAAEPVATQDSTYWQGEAERSASNTDYWRKRCKAAEQQAEPPQREWQGLTDNDWEQIHDRKGTALDTFAQGAVWAESQLRERNT